MDLSVFLGAAQTLAYRNCHAAITISQILGSPKKKHLCP